MVAVWRAVWLAAPVRGARGAVGWSERLGWRRGNSCSGFGAGVDGVDGRVSVSCNFEIGACRKVSQVLNRLPAHAMRQNIEGLGGADRSARGHLPWRPR